MTESSSLQIVVLDDYQQVIAGYADWKSLPDADLIFLQDHLVGEELITALADAEVVVAVRERTALSASVLAQLPRLRLIVTAGMSNAAIDVEAARSRRRGHHGLAVRITGTAAVTDCPADPATNRVPAPRAVRG